MVNTWILICGLCCIGWVSTLKPGALEIKISDEKCQTGRRQSPISIAERYATKVIGFEPIIFEKYGNSNNNETINSNQSSQHTSQPTISGGGLPGVYRLSQFHFHWGSQEMHGAEHAVYGSYAPVELHLVHYNTAYGNDIKEALKNCHDSWDTLAVLAVLINIQQEDNHNFDQIIAAPKFIKYLNQDIKNATTFFPVDLVLPKNKHDFFRYNGSLTSKPCSEIVIWTVFKDHVSISQGQVDKLHQVLNTFQSNEIGYTKDENFREIQPLNGRRVLDVSTL